MYCTCMQFYAWATCQRLFHTSFSLFLTLRQWNSPKWNVSSRLSSVCSCTALSDWHVSPLMTETNTWLLIASVPLWGYIHSPGWSIIHPTKATRSLECVWVPVDVVWGCLCVSEHKQGCFSCDVASCFAALHHQLLSEMLPVWIWLQRS